jgi:hypothetical protein
MEIKRNDRCFIAAGLPACAPKVPGRDGEAIDWQVGGHRKHIDGAMMLGSEMAQRPSGESRLGSLVMLYTLPLVLAMSTPQEAITVLAF